MQNAQGNMYINRGMYAEEIFNRTIKYYQSNGIALIEKRMIPIKIIKNISDNMIIGKLLDKSLVDYCGCYQGKHLEFEVKETNLSKLPMNIIQSHQLAYLHQVEQHKGFAFLIIYFSLYESFFLIPFPKINEYVSSHRYKTIPYEEIQKMGTKLEIIYPGIIDVVSSIKSIIG
ncbi:MAG: Holliday junction resolvase RecU [Mycoplasmataceae bacterium]|jgi:recombination protein U|nr:Holliday junction resolvase RecU [Mycoplasmataceae bacterium]